MSEIHETLEQAEHVGHGGGHSDPMMMRVAMTMAIIAATLAAVSVAGHRKHNAVLQLQGESNRLLAEAAGLKVEASNAFARYQSKRARVEEQERSVAFTKLFAAREGSEAFREEQVKSWETYSAANRTKPADIRKDENGFPVKAADGKEDDSLGALIVSGNRYKELAEEKVAETAGVKAEAEHAHHQADKLDWSHLALEFGLVLCTISVLTRKKVFWIAGVSSALVGAGLSVFALYLVH
jgi:hypothetical protein